MITNDKKFLTELMGECWHEHDTSDCYRTICKTCGLSWNPGFQIGCRNKYTFDNWNDFGVLWEWVKKQEWFDDLCKYLFKWYIPENKYEFINNINFPQIVVEFIKTSYIKNFKK